MYKPEAVLVIALRSICSADAKSVSSITWGLNPSLHAALTRVGELTGAPVLVNTSFNLHEEPIVCSPSDAVRAFKQARLDALWLGPFVATLPE